MTTPGPEEHIRGRMRQSTGHIESLLARALNLDPQAGIAQAAEPVDSEGPDAEHNPDVFELRRRVDLLCTELVDARELAKVLARGLSAARTLLIRLELEAGGPRARLTAESRQAAAELLTAEFRRAVSPEEWLEPGCRPVSEPVEPAAEDQAGASWRRRLIHQDEATGLWEIISVHAYPTLRDWRDGIQLLWEYLICSDPERPGETEIWGTELYEDRPWHKPPSETAVAGAVTELTVEQFAAKAAELCRRAAEGDQPASGHDGPGT